VGIALKIPCNGLKSRASLGFLIAALTVIVAPQAVTRLARRNEKLRPRLLKNWNAATTRIAGRRFSPVTLIEHTGRKSGRSYTTPLTSARFGDGFLLPLPYGPQVDWCRNVEFAGHAVLRRRGCRYRLERPQVMTIDAAVLKQLPAYLRRTIKHEARQGLWLHDTSTDGNRSVSTPS
jgi:deazaflavin-dependent oxidoreductase (nitroreductase family)